MDTGNRITILDGGTGAELQSRNVRPDPVCWHALAAITNPSELVSIHIDFINAGAQVITTNTFATHRYALQAAGYAELWESVNSASVAAARRARSQTRADVRIAGSMSCMPPAYDTKNYPDDALARASYADQAKLLADLGVDIIALEMIQDARHGGWALDAAIKTGLPVWLGIACRADQRSNEVVCFDQPDMRLDLLLRELLDREPQVVCIMHSPIDVVRPAFDCVREQWPGAIGVYPEPGSFDVLSRTRTQPVSPEKFAATAQQWSAIGARIIGGCCGTTPQHTKALATSLSSEL